MVNPYPYPYLREEERGGAGLTGAPPPLLIPTDLTGRTHQDIVAYNNQYHLHHTATQFIHCSRPQIAAPTQPQGACFPGFIVSESAKFTLSGDEEQEQEELHLRLHLHVRPRLHQPAFGPPFSPAPLRRIQRPCQPRYGYSLSNFTRLD